VSIGQVVSIEQVLSVGQAVSIGQVLSAGRAVSIGHVVSIRQVVSIGLLIYLAFSRDYLHIKLNLSVTYKSTQVSK
jgi:hypothetical protein